MPLSVRLATALAAILALAGCGGEERLPENVRGPAIWEISGPDSAVEGWMFGTIHKLSDEFAWSTPLLDKTVGEADLLVVEVARLDDGRAIRRLFQGMAFDRPSGPVMARIAPARRAHFQQLLTENRLDADQLDAMESWAVALTLSQIAQPDGADNGVDLALVRRFGGRKVEELEGAQRQLSIFDALPEKEQRDLLNAVLEETAEEEKEIAQLAESWRSGDTARLDELSDSGILADPELRKALLIDRNRNWAERLSVLLSAQPRPLVAVGAGHMQGPQGLPELLRQRGFAVRRIQ